MQSTPCNHIDLGTIDFPFAYKIQKDILKNVQEEKSEDTIIFLQHNHCLTIGRGALPDHFSIEKNKLDIPVYHTDRGGAITYHGPGQLVVYPIIDLKKRKKDLHLYLQQLQAVMIAGLGKFGFDCYAKKGFPGLWLNGKKIGFIGFAVSKWVSYHGFSININPQTKYFSFFRPCGIESNLISSIFEISNSLMNIQKLKETILQEFTPILTPRTANDRISVLA